MALSFGFYNSRNHDRVYDTRQISRLFNALIKDGVFMHIGSHFAVTEGSGMSVNVGTGYAWFNSTWTLNDAPLPITVEQSDLLLTRIDALVLEVNEAVNSRTNSIKFVKGAPSANPQKPSLTNTNDVHQYALAYITITPGTETITQANIENNVGMEECPFVVGILETIDISSLIAQWETEWDEWLTKQKSDFTTWSNERKQEIVNFQESSETSFLAWFENIKDKLGEDPAGELQNQVDDLKAAVTGYPLKLSANTNSLQIIAKRNSIESIGATGFTTQEGSGNPSLSNKRVISVATKRMMKVVVDGKSIANQTDLGTVTRFSVTIDDSVDYAKGYSSSLPYGTGYTTDEPHFYVNATNIWLFVENFRFSGKTLQSFLNENPIIVWFIPSIPKKSTGIYLPIERTDESGYHCDCIELSADLCAGDRVETCVKSGCDGFIVFDGSSDETWLKGSQVSGQFIISISAYNVIPRTGLCNAYAFSTAGSNQIGFCSITETGNLYFNTPFSDVSEWKQYLSSNPVKVWYRTEDYSDTIDVPVQLETHVKQGYTQIDGENTDLIFSSELSNLVTFFVYDAKTGQYSDSELICDIYPTGQYADGSSQIYVSSAGPTMAIHDPRFTDLETAKTLLSADPATVAYTLVSPPFVYARDPSFVNNIDGSTVVNTPEGCILELSLTKNEAKTYKATLLASSWTTSGSEFTQEATAKCVGGFSTLTADSKWDSPIYVEQTSVLATNEKLIDVLTILNMGEILFKDGGISCRVSEKPTSDIEIVFKAKR